MRSWLNGYGASENTGGDSGTDYTSDNFIGTAFSEKEQKAIADTDVFNDDNGDIEGGNTTTDKIFLLSIAEANYSDYFTDNDSRIATNTAYVADGGKIGLGGMYGVGVADFWWLRSPGSFYSNNAAYVYETGDVNSSGTAVNSDSYTVRPAFNLDLNSVLFTSAAEGGKSASDMDSGLAAVDNYDGNEWKLTLLDENRDFTVTEETASGKPGGIVTLNYTGAATGTNEYISVIIADNSGVRYYGRVAQPNNANGEVSFTIPDALAVGTYTLNVFSEQYNGDYKTDYASAFETVTLTVEIDTGKTVMLGTSGISGYDSTNGYDYIYFGKWTAPDTYTTSGPIKWRVLDDQTNTGETGLFLLSDALLGTRPYGDVYFDNSGNNSNVWQNSTARTWCNNFYSSSFSVNEQGAVLATTKSDKAFTSTGGVSFAASESILNGDKVFFLSVEEAENGAYGFTDDSARIANYGGSAGTWWLRSPDASPYLTDFAGRVYDHGSVGNCYVYNGWTARPAFNLNLSAVLFTSAAADGKSSGTMGTLTAVSDYTGNEWKLTLMDSNRNSFKASVSEQDSVSVVAGRSIEVSYSDAKTGDNEYVSVLLCDNDGNVLYYGNIAQNSASGTATLNIPSGLATGNYTLKVFSEQRNGDYKTDYAGAFQEISLNVLPKEATPRASFTATGDNSGTLSGVDTTMKYSTDGGAIWNDITGTTAEITGVTADKDIQVVKKGDGTATADSDAQIIDVTQAATPTGIGKTDCTTTAQNDGTITGVDSTMEYKLSTASEWASISGNTVAGLENGTYEIRVKANGTVLASETATVTIGEHTCVAQGAWQYDADEHWKLCACGAEVGTEAHSGGTATCSQLAVCEFCGSQYGNYDADNHKAVSEWTQENGKHYHKCEYGCDTHLDEADCSGGEATCTALAICEVCGQSYGEKDMNNHTDTVVWVQTATTHKQVYSCCQTEASKEEKHNWADGKCTVCDYSCTHTGGTATCSQLAVCELCGSRYGDLNPDNHKAVSEWTQENGKHYHKCEYGCDTHLDEADCSGGEATCTALEVCETCGNSYGAINPDNHTGEIVWTKTATDHSSKFSCCNAPVVTEEAHEWENGVCSECGYECLHSGGTATCADKAVCDICGEKYGEVNAANHTNLVKTEAKPATHMTEGNIEYWYCDGCDKYYSDEAGTKEIALADTVIPKLTEHTADGTGWHSDETNHWNTCECGEKLNEAAHTFEWVIDKEATATEKGSKHEECTVCGYEKAAVEIPATGTPSDTDTSSPQTGVLWIGGDCLRQALP